MKDCIFCKIASGEIQHNKVYEDKYSVAFLDKNQLNVGHTLIISKKHFENLEDIPEEELVNMIKAVKKIGKGMLKIADGLNVLQNNKKMAGQAINHIHFHLIPRYNGDGRSFEWEYKRSVTDLESKEFLKKIKKLL